MPTSLASGTPDAFRSVGIRDRNARCDLVGKNEAAIDVLATSKSCLASVIQQRIVSLVQIESTAVAPAQQYGSRGSEHKTKAPGISRSLI
jgi:hypothetical protein